MKRLNIKNGTQKIIQIMCFFLLISTNNNVLASGGGGGTPGMPCDEALPFCSDENYDFPNVSNGTVAPSGANYGCLGSEPNPVWYFMEIAESGPIQLNLSQSTGPNGTGSGLDVDFAMWGPFTDVGSGCNQIMNGNLSPLQCSYSAAPTETLGIGMSGGAGSGQSTPPNAQAGEIYIVLITNYDGANGYISFNQTNYGQPGAGETDCSIVDPCDIDNFTATPTDCDNDLYDVSGVIEVSSPPESGDLVVEDCQGNQTIIASAPFGTSYNYNLTGLPADGANCELSAYFTVGSCSETASFTAPVCDSPCLISNLEVSINACDPDNTFSVDGFVEFDNPPTSGQLVVEDCSGNSNTFNAPFTSPQNFQITGIEADGQNCGISVYFTAAPDCEISISYTNTADCSCSADIGSFTNVGVEPGNNVLCYGESYTITQNGDYTPAAEANNPPLAEGYAPDIGWLIYSCPPSVAITPDPNIGITDDPCFVAYMSYGDFGDLNDLSLLNSYPSGTFTDNTVYIVPITFYNAEEGYYSYVNTTHPCYSMGDYYAVQYLPEVTESHTADCQAGTVTATLTGGSPAVNGTQFTGENLSPSHAQFDNSTANNNGTITISGLLDGDEYAFDALDDNGCSITVSGVFQGVAPSDFTYDEDSYCLNESNPTPVITGETGGSFTASPSGLSINASTGVINLASSNAGTYTVTYTSPGSPCNSITDFEITLYDVPSYNITSTPPSCGNADGQIVISGLDATTPYNLEYSKDGDVVGPNSITSTSNGEHNIDNISQGVYGDFSITNNGGCTTNNPQDIILNPSDAPIVTAPDDLEICIGESITLTAQNPDGGNLLWSGGVTDGVAFTPNAPGTYVYTVTSTIDNCTASDNVEVIVHPEPTINAGQDRVVCDGETIVLSASGAANYQWDNNVTDGVPFVPSIGNTTYEVVGTTINGCESAATVNITVNPLPSPNFEGEDLYGCRPHQVQFTNTTVENGVECLWDFGDGTTGMGCNQITHTYNQSGVYSVSLTVTDNIGCSGTFEIENYVEIIPPAIADFSADPMEPSTVATTVNFYNSSENASEYEWTFGDDSPMSTANNPSHVFPEEAGGEYVVTLVASNGSPECNDTTKMVIIVKEETIFYVPNSFTPDKDDYNEVFKPVFASGFDPFSYTLEIYNRWGELLFVSHNWEVGWNGTYGVDSDKIVKDGVYIWKIKVKENGKDKHNEYVGHVTLLK